MPEEDSLGDKEDNPKSGFVLVLQRGKGTCVAIGMQ